MSLNVLPCLGFHQWAPWTPFRDIDVYGDGFGNATKHPTGFYRVYHRKCERCGIGKFRKAKR